MKLEKYKLNEFFVLVYDWFVNFYCFVSDYINVIYSGEEVFCLFCENGDYGGEVVWFNKMGDVYLFFGEDGKVKESFEKVLEYYFKEVLRFKEWEYLKGIFVIFFCNLGVYLMFLFEFINVRDFFE